MGRFFSVLFVAFIFVGIIYLLKNEEGLELLKPTPAVSGESSQIAIINDWFPKEIDSKNSDDIYVSAKSALVVNFETGDVLYAKEANARLPAASTIKIMTAMVVVDNARLNQTFTVSEKAAKVGENSMGLTAGEKLTVGELLYGLMLVSGNDTAITVAEGVSGSEDAFVVLMNEKAKALGLVDTKFINAAGLDDDGKVQYTSARELATIAHYAWENYPDIRKIASTYEKYIPATVNHKEFLLYNDTNLLTSYPGVKGIKPGFTWEAGWCLVTYAENDGKKLLGVILGSEDRRGEMVLLLDYAFSKYNIKVDHPGLDL